MCDATGRLGLRECLETTWTIQRVGRRLKLSLLFVGTSTGSVGGQRPHDVQRARSSQAHKLTHSHTHLLDTLPYSVLSWINRNSSRSTYPIWAQCVSRPLPQPHPRYPLPFSSRPFLFDGRRPGACLLALLACLLCLLALLANSRRILAHSVLSSPVSRNPQHCSRLDVCLPRTTIIVSPLFVPDFHYRSDQPDTGLVRRHRRQEPCSWHPWPLAAASRYVRSPLPSTALVAVPLPWHRCVMERANGLVWVGVLGAGSWGRLLSPSASPALPPALSTCDQRPASQRDPPLLPLRRFWPSTMLTVSLRAPVSALPPPSSLLPAAP
jgi:hypothetical protein